MFLFHDTEFTLKTKYKNKYAHTHTKQINSLANPATYHKKLIANNRTTYRIVKQHSKKSKKRHNNKNYKHNNEIGITVRDQTNKQKHSLNNKT